MNPRTRLPRLLLPVCILAMQLGWPAAEIRGQNIKPSAIRELARVQAPGRAELALTRARTAMKAQDFVTAHNKYRIAADSTRGVAGMEKVRTEAVRGFAESGVKLAAQRKAQGKLSEAEQILREILGPQYDPKYQPAMELLSALAPAVPKVQGFAATPPTKRVEPPSIAEFRPTPAGTPRPAPKATPPTRIERAPPSPATIVPLETLTRTEKEFLAQSSPPAASPAASVAKKPLVKVFFGTDRLPSGNRGPSKYFGIDWNKAAEPLITGVVTVSIPPVHEEGKIERPTNYFVYEQKEDLKKHFVLTEIRVSKGDDFYSELQSEFEQRADEERSAFVYIHGFNVTFDEAAYSTAQIAYDLDFKGVPMMFSWPSQGEVLAYDGDEETVDFSAPNLQIFLERVARNSGAKRIHIMAHSMGNRLLTRALGELVRQADIQPLFDNVIMASPDVNARLFTRLWPQIKVAANRFTLYASSDDRALISSRKAKGGSNFARLGEGGPNITVIPGLDTIDASGIDTSLLGHSYEASCKPVMNDLGLLIRTGFAPLERKLPARKTTDGLGYWGFP
jgi:esterase/lipase superfamily enzyme